MTRFGTDYYLIYTQRSAFGRLLANSPHFKLRCGDLRESGNIKQMAQVFEIILDLVCLSGTRTSPCRVRRPGTSAETECSLTCFGPGLYAQLSKKCVKSSSKYPFCRLWSVTAFRQTGKVNGATTLATPVPKWVSFVAIDYEVIEVSRRETPLAQNS
ncbi:hypothetical protein CPB86DRAFT_215885 [Serendipita vermifera]|nr:hypothetical protein CPB86DRAFT_215885 [Serendipita vermifera]